MGGLGRPIQFRSLSQATDRRPPFSLCRSILSQCEKGTVIAVSIPLTRTVGPLLSTVFHQWPTIESDEGLYLGCGVCRAVSNHSLKRQYVDIDSRKIQTQVLWFGR